MIRIISEAGLSHVIYDGCIYAGWVLSIAYGVIFCKKFGISKGKAVVSLSIFAVLNLFLIRAVCWMYSGFRVWGAQNMIKAFIYFPITSWIISKIFRINSKVFLDFNAPCHCITIALAHVGCSFMGCCHGYPCTFGVYNPVLQKTLFPIQFLEAAVALSVAYITIRYCKDRDYCVNGKAYPLMLMLFGYVRFFLEFLRDNDKLLWGISDLAFHALAAGIIGTVAYIGIRSKEKKQLNQQTQLVSETSEL